MKSVDGFVYDSYRELPIEKVIEIYRKESVPTEIIFSRLQWLEYSHFQDSAGRFRRDIKEHNSAERLYNNLEKEYSDISEKYQSLLNRLGIKRKTRERVSDEEKKELERFKELKKKMKESINDLSKKINELSSKTKTSQEELRNFDYDYAKELEFIYSQGLVDNAFAWLRLIKPGKLRIKEPLLIAQYKALPLQEFFNSEYLDSIDRERLAKAESPDGKYLISSKVLENRLRDLPKRIKDLNKLIRDAKELREMGLNKQYDEDKLYSRLQDLLYERDAMEKCIKERK